VGHATHVAQGAQAWATVVGIGFAVAITMFWLALALISNRRPPGPGGSDDPGSGPGGGGPGRRGPDGGDAPDGSPAWWADFERQFAAYASARTASVVQGTAGTDQSA
jgi:hypothetical protein